MLKKLLPGVSSLEAAARPLPLRPLSPSSSSSPLLSSSLPPKDLSDKSPKMTRPSLLSLWVAGIQIFGQGGSRISGSKSELSDSNGDSVTTSILFSLYFLLLVVVVPVF